MGGVATAEPKPRTKLERLRAGVKGREEEKVRLEESIRELLAEERNVVEAELGERPGSSPFRVGSRALELRSKRGKAETRLRNLAEELDVLSRKLRDEENAQAIEQLEKTKREARKLDKAERGALEGTVNAFEEFVRGYAVLCEVVEQREQLFGGIGASTLNLMSDAERYETERAFKATLEPFPASASILADAILRAAADPSRIGYRGSCAEVSGDRLTLALVPLVDDLSRTYRKPELRFSEVKQSWASCEP